MIESRFLSALEGLYPLLCLRQAYNSLMSGGSRRSAEAVLKRICSINDDFKASVLLGCPIMHSLSPALHASFADYEDKNDIYVLSCLEKNNVYAFLEAWQKIGNKGPLIGANVTRPYKENAFSYLKKYGRLTEAALNIGAVNTIYFEGDALCGDNTDYSGWLNSWKEEIQQEISGREAVVFGSGGAARALVYALICEGIGSVKIVNKTQERASRLIRDFSETSEKLGRRTAFVYERELSVPFRDGDIVIQTTPVGQAPDTEKSVCVWEGGSFKNAAACDVIYAPLKTKFLRDAQASGAKICSGASMLICQAYKARKRFFAEPCSQNIKYAQYIRLLSLFE